MAGSGVKATLKVTTTKEIDLELNLAQWMADKVNETGSEYTDSLVSLDDIGTVREETTAEAIRH